LKSLRLDTRLPHSIYVPVLLTAVVLAVYFPAFGNGIHSIDDPGIIAYFTTPPSLLDILLPGRNYYYRPIIELSYYIDSKWWGMEPSVMHLENILLHILNTLLVFTISRKIAAYYPERSLFIPLLAALLFALHPLNVEAVSWISGRTDPLAALFLLSSCLIWLYWLDKPHWQYAIGILFLIGLGLLTKETSLASLPIAFLFVLAWPGLSARRRLIATVSVVSVVVVIIVAAVIWKSGVQNLWRLVVNTGFETAGWCQNSVVAFGFYVKKLLVPLPLNFAITEVNPAYALVGIVAIVALAGVFVVWRLSALFFMASALMIFPALIVASKQIAWTPFAERYMYIPTAFLCIGTNCLFHANQQRILNRLALMMLIIVCIAGIVSFQRNLLWHDKLAFYQDTVAHSPAFGSVYYELGGQFLQYGQIDKAAEAFAAADRLNRRPSMKLPIKANILGTMVAKGDFVRARGYFFELFPQKKTAPAEFLQLLYTADSKRLESLSKEDKVTLAHDLLETLELLYLKKPDPFWFYQSGKMALITGSADTAVDFFKKAYKAAPVDAHYKGAAKTYVMRLEAGK